jgi:hypothetical protein
MMVSIHGSGMFGAIGLSAEATVSCKLTIRSRVRIKLSSESWFSISLSPQL